MELARAQSEVAGSRVMLPASYARAHGTGDYSCTVLDAADS